ncbi:MAG: DUF6677 family protein [Planctomycetota bacterium]|nr:DUF6677 family protein [Planctomycetota bacterium]
MMTDNSLFDRILAAVLTWLIPGAGYWILGYRKKALALGIILLGLFWTGESILGGSMAVTYEVHPVFFYLEAGNGLSTFISNWAWGDPVHEDGLRSIQNMPVHLNLGILCCVVSGMLNILLVLNILDSETWQQAANGPAKEGEAE